MWDGANWVPNAMTQTAPPAAAPPTVSPDGLWVWSGAHWVPNTLQATAPYASADVRAMLTTILIAINLIGVVLFIAYDVLEELQYTEGAPDESTLGTAVGLVALFAAFGYFGSLIVAVVFFCMWLHRIVRNMPSLRAPNPIFSPAVAVGLCFVPFVNLVQPLLSVIDAWAGSMADGQLLLRERRMSARVATVVVAWWAGWLIARVLQFVGTLVYDEKNASSRLEASVLDIAGNVVLAIAAVLAIVVVRRLTARQDARNRAMMSGQPA